MNPLIAARIGATFFVLFLVFSVCAWAIAELYARWFDQHYDRPPHPSMSDDDWERAINDLRWKGEQ
jgi:hypothetical protein